jgi:ribonuclease BN (tRNA processing enzyme)
MKLRALAVLVACTSGLPLTVSAQMACSDAPLGVQVLGSGGPFVGSSRASSGYLVWREGRAVVMIDAGGGTFLRFGEAGARLADLEALAISHLHPDHVSDLPGLLWLSETVRERPLTLVGPSAGGVFPDMEAFVSRLFDSNNGAFPILGGTLGDPGRRGTPLDVHVVDATRGNPTDVLRRDGLRLTAMGVPHSSLGVVDATTPSIAYRVEVGDRSIVFSSDQNGSDDRFVEFAARADVLVMHFAASRENAGQVHATPQVVGRIAREAEVGRLVLSHVIEPPDGVPNPGRFSGARLEESVALVEGAYPGPIDVATDLQCFRVR